MHINSFYIDSLIHLFFRVLSGIECHAVLDRNPESGYNTLFSRLIPGYIYSACLNRQFLALPVLLHSNPVLLTYACVSGKGCILCRFMVVFGMARPGQGANPRPTANANHYTVRCVTRRFGGFRIKSFQTISMVTL